MLRFVVRRCTMLWFVRPSTNRHKVVEMCSALTRVVESVSESWFDRKTCIGLVHILNTRNYLRQRNLVFDKQDLNSSLSHCKQKHKRTINDPDTLWLKRSYRKNSWRMFFLACEIRFCVSLYSKFLMDLSTVDFQSLDLANLNLTLYSFIVWFQDPTWTIEASFGIL